MSALSINPSTGVVLLGIGVTFMRIHGERPDNVGQTASTQAPADRGRAGRLGARGAGDGRPRPGLGRGATAERGCAGGARGAGFVGSRHRAGSPEARPRRTRQGRRAARRQVDRFSAALTRPSGRSAHVRGMMTSNAGLGELVQNCAPRSKPSASVSSRGCRIASSTPSRGWRRSPPARLPSSFRHRTAAAELDALRPDSRGAGRAAAV